MSTFKKTDLRETPVAFFISLDRRYHFDLDVCATAENALCRFFLGPGSELAEDALAQGCDWSDFGERIWMNPPYSQIPLWLAKAVGTVQSMAGVTIVALLPAGTSTGWFHTHLWDRDRGLWRPWVRRVAFHHKRLVFGPHSTGAKWPSIVVELGADDRKDNGKFTARRYP